MKNCHVCGFACADDAETCVLCGAELKTFAEYEKQIELEREEAEKEALIVKEPVLAASVENVVMAEIYKDVLRDNKIPFTCDERDDSMQIVFGGGFTAQDIYVKEEDLKRAKALYEEVLNSQFEFSDEDFEGFEEEEYTEE